MVVNVLFQIKFLKSISKFSFGKKKIFSSFEKLGPWIVLSQVKTRNSKVIRCYSYDGIVKTLT